MINCRKILAMFLIFTLTFSNFAFVTQSFAAGGFMSLFGDSTGTGNDNVEFNAYLKNGEETSDAMASDVNNENLSIKLQLGVKESGYLKDGKVEIKPEDGEELNFEIKKDGSAETPEETQEVLEEETQVPTESEKVLEEETQSPMENEEASENEIQDLENKVQSLEDNILTLRKIESSSDDIEISIPIQYKSEEYINESKLCNTSKVILSGIYVDEDGDENEISKEVDLTLAWKDEREVKVETEVSKYVQFGTNGVILQTIVRVDSSNIDKNSLPVKATELNIDAPKINDVIPSEVTIVANSTKGTNGKGVGEVEFSNDNWTYNTEENKLTIKVENAKQLVNVNETEGYLKVEGEEEKQEERYYSVAGMDEYVITYVFQNVEVSDEMNVTCKADAKLSIFNGVESDNNETVATAENVGEFTLTGQTGNIVSYDIENETENVSKIYAYLGSETEFNSKTSINVSIKDLVEEIRVEDVQNYYIDKSGNSLQADDIYYKEISLSQENFVEILGEEGNIEILDVAGNVIATINKDCTVNENGNYIVSFQDRISKVTIKTSTPVSTGNLVLSSKKAVSAISIAKDHYANMEYLATDTVQKAKLEYVSELAELGNCTTKTILEDTETNFNLIIDRNSLSTVTTNSDVEMRLELNNDEITSDIYGNSVFEIEMPEYITGLNITNYNMIYGEGLELSSVETYVRDGKIVIKITVNGQQTALNSGVLTNGTNIVLNMDIDVDMYAPSKDETITAYGYNSQATNYRDIATYTINDVTTCGVAEADISYSAPSGLVAVNSLSNYNDAGSVLTSIKEGSKVDYLDIYSPARNAKSEIILINNNDNAVSDLAILGRIPFSGVKDIDTENELGTTIDTKLTSLITANENNKGDFMIYYSTNYEATKDLNDESNGWVSNPESLEYIKSYLIVPTDSNYEMGAKEVLRFSYEYEIPENLEHNEKIYGTFLAYYENGSVSETVRPDLVGLSTGAGPELDLSVKTDVTKIKELNDFTITATVTNTGEDLANDVVLSVPVPSNTTYVSAEASRDSATVSYEDGKVVANIVRLEKDATVELAVIVKVNETENENANKISISASANAKDLQKEINVTADDVEIQISELLLGQYMNFAYQEATFSKDSTLDFVLYAKNISDSNKENVTVSTQLPKELEFSRAYMLENFYSMSSTDEINEVQNATYDSSTNKVTWNLGTLEPGEKVRLILILTTGDLDDGLTSKKVNISSQISADKAETYNAKDMSVNLGKASLSIVQTSGTPTYVKEGDTIDYTFTIKNEGDIPSGNISLTDLIPEGVMVKKISYTVGDQLVASNVALTDNASTTLTVPEDGEVNVDLEAVATSLDGVQEQTVTNEGTITDSNGNVIKSNSVTHIIQAKENNTNNESSSSNVPSSNTNTNSTDITKSYKITGTAWLDANKNGMRDSGESRMKDITAMLVDSSTGVIKATTTTDSNGEYSFAGLQNGTYLVLFKYDTVLYTTTAYKKEGVETSLNSDVVTTKIEQDGKKENGAVTDAININGASASNIDIGLVEAAQFSLQLDKSITKITVQNAQGTKTETFDKTKLAKYDITAKYLSGTTVYVEYTFTATNNGDLAGYASEIVDYIPEGMTFNSSLNKDWYTGTDGNLCTKALANTELSKGQSKEITLVLTKQMTEENTGIVSNTAEIADDYNIYGVSDNNSTPANKAQGEDDISTADVILTVKTGEVLIYVSAIIISLIIASAVGFVVYKKLIIVKRKGGV